MTLREWLAVRPSPPPRLAERIGEILGSRLDGEAEAFPFLDAASELLTTINREARHTRAAALDLLVADALATYAFELQAERGGDLLALADVAMAQLSRTSTPA